RRAQLTGPHSAHVRGRQQKDLHGGHAVPPWIECTAFMPPWPSGTDRSEYCGTKRVQYPYRSTLGDAPLKRYKNSTPFGDTCGDEDERGSNHHAPDGA